MEPYFTSLFSNSPLKPKGFAGLWPTEASPRAIRALKHSFAGSSNPLKNPPCGGFPREPVTASF